MRSQMVGLLLTGLILVGVTSTDAVEDVPLDFFIDPETGEPHVVIVVGSEAASQDVISAARLAVKIDSMSTGDDSIPFVKPSRAIHEHINPFLTNAGTYTHSEQPDEVERLGFLTVDVPDAGAYTDWECNILPINYTLSLWYFDDPNRFWGSNDGHFQPWETHEEIQICFDGYTQAPSEPEWIACLYGGDMQFKKLTSESSDFPTWYNVPGLIYRVDNIFVPPSIIAEGHFPVERACIVGPCSWSDWSPLVFAVPEPWLIIHDMLPRFGLFNTVYTVVDGGAVLDMSWHTGELGPLHGTPYLVGGEPYFEAVYLYKGESVVFGSYTISLVDVEVDIERDKAWFEIYLDDDLVESFWMVLIPQYGFSLDMQQENFPFDTYDTCNDLNDNKKLDPGEMTNIFSLDISLRKFVTCQRGCHKRLVSGHAEKDIWLDFQWKYYIDDHDAIWELFRVPTIAVDGVRVFADDQGTGAEINVYWLENEIAWYNRSSLCDPWDCNLHYHVFLDAYESGWDITDGNSYVHQPPGTGLWPPLGLSTWAGNSVFAGNGFLDANDGHTGYECNLASLGHLPEQNDLDRDNCITNDCRTSDGSLQTDCTNRHDIEDPVIWHGPGVIMVEMNIFLAENVCAPDQPWVVSGPYLKEPSYFTVTVTDVWFQGNSPGITYETVKESILSDRATLEDIDETGLVTYDTQFDFDAWKTDCDYNLILIGGPVANAVVNQLVDEGISRVDWTVSPGQWEHIKAYTCGILIVAGADRDSTNSAVQRLINQL